MAEKKLTKKEMANALNGLLDEQIQWENLSQTDLKIIYDMFNYPRILLGKLGLKKLDSFIDTRTGILGGKLKETAREILLDFLEPTK